MLLDIGRKEAQVHDLCQAGAADVSVAGELGHVADLTIA
jgi:hypothetical protein